MKKNWLTGRVTGFDPIPRLAHIFALALALFIAPGAWAFPSPTVVWDGDFGTTTKTGTDGVEYTFTLNPAGNTGENLNTLSGSTDGNLVIGSDSKYGGQISWEYTDSEIYTSVLIKYSNFAASDKKALASVSAETTTGGNKGQVVDDCVGVLSAANSTLTGRYNDNSNTWPKDGTSVATSYASGYLMIVYGAGQAFQFYASNDGVTWNGGTASGLTFGTTYACGVGLGGMSGLGKDKNGAANNGYDVSSGMIIEGVAIFRNRALSVNQARSYYFDSEYTTNAYKNWASASAVFTWHSTTGTDIGTSSGTSVSLFSIASGSDTSLSFACGGNTTYTGSLFWYGLCKGQTTYYTPGYALRVTSAHANKNITAGFAPLTLGGLIIEEGAANINFSDTSSRATILGAATDNLETWFGIYDNATISREGYLKFSGMVNLEVAKGKTFTISATGSPTVVREVTDANGTSTAGGALKMHGLGTMVVSTLTATGGATLDFSDVQEDADVSRSTTPFIQGSLTVDSTTKFVFPAELAANTAYTLCSGTLTGPTTMICDIVVGTTVKENVTLTFSGNTVSYDDTVVYSATVSGTAVTWLDGSAPASLDNATVNFSGSGVVTGLSGNGTTINTSSDVTVDVTSFTSPTLLGSGTYRYTSSYPTVVPTAEYSYEYVASGTSTQIDGVTVNGTLKTSGNIVLASFRLNAGGTLDVLSDVTMMQAAVQKALSGNMTVRAGATLTNLQTADGYYSDAVNYDQTGMKIEVYGTLALKETRWSLRQKNYHEFRLHDTAVISGTGDGDGALDWFESCGGMFDVYDGTATVSANMRVRSGATTANWVQDGAKLKFTGSTSGAGAFSKSGAGTLSLSGTHTQTGGVSVSDGTIELDNVSYTSGTITLSSADRAPTLKMIATDSSTTVSATVNVPANTRGSLAFEGAGTFALSGPSVSGNTVWLGSDLTDGALMLNGAVSINNGSRGRTYTINKIAGGSGNLGIAAWSTAYDSNDTALTYVVNKIAADDYSGTIVLGNASTDERGAATFAFSVGDIIGTAVYGTPIVKVTTNVVARTSGSNKINVDVSATKLNGSAAAFLYDGSVTGSEGIYLAEATYDNINYKTLQAAYDAAQNAAGDISDIIVYNNSATAPTGCALVDNGNGTYAVRAAGEVYWTAGYWATGGNTKISVVTSDGRSTTVVSGDTVVVDDRTSDTAYVAGTLIGGFSSVRIARDTTMASGAGSDTIFDGVTVTIDSAKTLTFIPSNWHNIIIGSTVFNGNAVVLSDNASASKTLTVSGAVTGSATVNIAGTVTIASTGSIANAIVLADGATLVVQSGGSVPTPTTVPRHRVKTVTSGDTTTYSVEAIPGTTFTVY